MRRSAEAVTLRIRATMPFWPAPAAAIRQHLVRLATTLSVPASNCVVLEESRLAQLAPELIDNMEELDSDPDVLNQFGTIRYSLKAMAKGLEAGTGPTSGNVLMEPREPGIAHNVQHILNDCPHKLLYDQGIYFRGPVQWPDFCIDYLDVEIGEVTELFARRGDLEHAYFELAVSPDEKWLLFSEPAAPR